MPKKATSTSAVYEAPGIKRASDLRPDAIARIELLRIIYVPSVDADTLIEKAKKLEAYVAGGQALSGPA